MIEDLKETSESGVIQNLFGTGDENVRLLEQLLQMVRDEGQDKTFAYIRALVKTHSDYGAAAPASQKGE